LWVNVAFVCQFATFHERLCFATAAGIHPTYKIAIEAFAPELKWPDREANHSPPLLAKINLRICL